MIKGQQYSGDYKIVKPELKSNETGKISTQNKIFGKIEECFSSQLLQQYDLNSISFDFFINWEKSKLTGQLNPNLWFKRTLVINDNIKKYINLKERDVFVSRLVENESFNVMVKKYKFLSKYNLSARYMIIKDNIDFSKSNNSPIIVSCQLVENGIGEKIETYTINELNDMLIKNSGGKFTMKKKLTYSETRLEYFLSLNCEDTGALWPGDCDMILFDDEFNCKCILEFKKCTSFGNVKVEEQSFTTYYSKDKNKYTRIGILRDYLSNLSNETIPYIVVFYPTNEENKLKIQSIGGSHKELKELNSIVIDIPKSKDIESVNSFKNLLIEEVLKI